MYFHIGLFRSHLIIYNGAFLRKSTVEYFPKKSSIVDVRLGSKYVFASNYYETIVTTNEKMVWKHKPNWSLYALMLRTKLY